jgi:tripartite-type tricarboxylate transporter receptor subunit TctC
MKIAIAQRATRLLLASLALLVAAPVPGQAQGTDYPNKRVNFIVGFAAGGFADSTARWVAARMGERTGQAIVVQNMEGGGGIRAARAVAMAPPDGYTVLVTTTSLAINESLAPDRGYTAASFEAISLPVDAPEALSVSAKAPLKTLAAVIKEAKAGKVFVGSAGIGTGSYISSEYFFKVLAKVPVKHIPFPGGNPAMLALLQGDIMVLASTATGNLTRNHRNGDVIGIGIAADKRWPALPDVPTFTESGYPGPPAGSWTGFFAPAGTPEAVLAKLNSEINAIMQEPEVAKRFESAGLQITIRDRATTAKLFQTDIANWSTMVKAVGVKQ